ncbi:unnamed protein product, partial [Closterium sp. NIES-54]
MMPASATHVTAGGIAPTYGYLKFTLDKIAAPVPLVDQHDLLTWKEAIKLQLEMAGLLCFADGSVETQPKSNAELRADFCAVHLLTIMVISRCCSRVTWTLATRRGRTAEQLQPHEEAAGGAGHAGVAQRGLVDFIHPLRRGDTGGRPGQRGKPSGGGSGNGRPNKDADKGKSAIESSRGGGGRRRDLHSCRYRLAPEAGEDFQAVAAAVQANPAVVQLNSGRSHHLMGTKEAFVELKPSGDVKHVRSFNGALQDVQDRGAIALQGETGMQVLIPDVLYVPGVQANLLSAGQLKESGVKLQDEGDGKFLISAAGNVLGRVKYTRRVLFTNLRPCTATSTSMPAKWHVRLAHIGIDTIKSVSQVCAADFNSPLKQFRQWLDLRKGVAEVLVAVEKPKVKANPVIPPCLPYNQVLAHLGMSLGLDKFNGDSFAEWSFKMEKSAQGYLLLGQALGGSQIRHIKPFQREPEKGPKAWAALKGVHAPATVAVAVVLERQKAALRIEEDKAVEEGVLKFFELLTWLEGADLNYSELQKKTKLLALLPESWSSLIIDLNRDLPRHSFEDVKRAILQEDFRRRELAGSDGAGAASIGRVYGHGRGRGRGGGRFGGSNYNGGHGSGSYGNENKNYGRGRGQFDCECHFCHKSGHLWRDCYKLSDGWTPPQGQEGRGAGGGRGRGRGGRGGRGGGAASMKSAGNESESRDDRFPGQFFFMSTQAPAGPEKDEGFEEPAAVGKVTLHSLDYWVIDSGATYSMTPRADLLTKLEPSPMKHVTSALGQRAEVKGMGKAMFKGADGKMVGIKNVLWVPNLAANLISVWRSQKAGMDTSSKGAKTYTARLGERILWDLHEDRDVYNEIWQIPVVPMPKERQVAASISTKGEAVGSGDGANGRAKEIDSKKCNLGGTSKFGEHEESGTAAQKQHKGEENPKEASEEDYGESMWGTIASAAFSNPTSATGECDWLTLHAIPILQQLLKIEMVAGIRVKREPHEVLGCPTCMQAKFTRYPFSSSEATAKAPLDEVVMDVVGPLKLGAAGAEYFLTIVDVCTRMTWVYVLSKKSDVAETVKTDCDTSLEFRGGPESLKQVGYVDAGDAGNKQNRTSTGGYVFVFGGAAVSWSSQQSTGKEGHRLHFLLAEFLLLDARTPTVLRVDNKSAITVTEGLGLQGNLKHMDRRYAWLQHMVTRRKFVLEVTSAEDRAASTQQPCPASPPSFPSFPQFPPRSSLRPVAAEPGDVPAGGTGGSGGVGGGGVGCGDTSINSS